MQRNNFWLRFPAMAAAGLLVLSGCSNNKVEEADDREPDQAQMNASASQADSATTADNNNDNVNRDLNFYEEAARGSMFEIQASQIAVTKAKNAEVKKFAQMMITDHQKASKELADLAQKKQILLPTELPNNGKNTIEDLREDAADEDFDEEYMEAMVDAHENDVNLFERQSKNSGDAEAQAWAEKMLPTLRAHLQQARQLEERVDDKDGNSRRERAGNTGGAQ